jgi:hypothetical protein
MVQLHGELHSCSLALDPICTLRHPSHFLLVQGFGHFFDHGSRFFVGGATQVEGAIADRHIRIANEHRLLGIYF